MFDGEYGNCDIMGDTQDSEYQWNENRPFDCPLVEAIPIAEVKKFLEEGTKDVSNKVLAIVREEYIHKADYEKRLKADMVAMLTEIQLEIEELEPLASDSVGFDMCVSMSSDIIQQKINALRG
jgi:hypothetical protein